MNKILALAWSCVGIWIMTYFDGRQIEGLLCLILSELIFNRKHND